jgi:hypothetical protein
MTLQDLCEEVYRCANSNSRNLIILCYYSFFGQKVGLFESVCFESLNLNVVLIDVPFDFKEIELFKELPFT